MKSITIVTLCFLLTGCSRSFWAPNWEIAEAQQQITNQLKRIADSLEKIELRKP